MAVVRITLTSRWRCCSGYQSGGKDNRPGRPYSGTHRVRPSFPEQVPSGFNMCIKSTSKMKIHFLCST